MTVPVAPLHHHDSPPTPHAEHPEPRPDRTPLIQRLLLGAGALCVLVAGSVYLAVSWHTLGVTGQAGIALAVTVLAALAAHLLTRRGLRASAETFALVASGLLALDLAGAHRLDVLGAGQLERWAWLAAATGILLVVTSGLAAVDRLHAYRSVVVAALGVLPWFGVRALAAAGLEVSAGAETVLALTCTAGLACLGAVLARRDAVAAVTAAVAAGGWWLFAAIAGARGVASGDTYADVVPAGAAWAVVAAALLWATGRVLVAGRDTSTVTECVSAVAPLLASPGVLFTALAAARLGPVGAIVTAVAAAGLFVVRWPMSVAGRPVGVGVLAVLALLPVYALLHGDSTDVAAALTLLLAAALAGAAVRARGAVAGLLSGAGLVAVLTGLALLSAERLHPVLWLACGWTGVAVVLTCASAFVPQRRDVVTALAAVTSCAALIAGFAGQVADTTSPALVVTLFGLGAAQVARGAARAARVNLLLGAGALTAGALDLAHLGHVTTVEAYTLPIAAVALLAGILGRVGRPSLTSWAWAGPGLLIALLPTTVLALADSGVIRLVTMATVAAALTVLGVRCRWAAPLVLGAVTEAVLAISQLAPYAVGAPRWISLAAAGAVLLTLGVLFERARRSARAAGHWYATLD